MVDPQGVLSFPDELLIKIFEFCDVPSLGRLAQTCKRFRHIIYTEDSCWRSKSADVICSNMFSEKMQLRCQPFLSPQQRCKVSLKWVEGVNVETTIATYSQCMPWLTLEKDYLFYSMERWLVRYPRKQDGNVGFKRDILMTIPHTDDVSKFAINGDEIVTAGRDGMLGRLSKLNFRYIHQNQLAHGHEMYCVDAKRDIIVTGSRDTYVKIWKAFPNYTRLEKEISMLVRVLSVAIMPSNSHYIVGLPGVDYRHPLKLFDFERDEPVTNFGSTYRKGAGILDICPECDNTFFAGGYDTTVKLWDIRAPQRFVASWMEPYDNGIYCVQTDHNVTLMSGANRSGLVHIWDKRMPGQNSIHVYSEQHSPAYSIAFDASHLFIACDRAITQFSYV